MIRAPLLTKWSARALCVYFIQKDSSFEFSFKCKKILSLIYANVNKNLNPIIMGVYTFTKKQFVLIGLVKVLADAGLLCRTYK